jgi:hypothetical protein
MREHDRREDAIRFGAMQAAGDETLGATIGGLTSFVTSSSIQRAQLRHAHLEAETAKLEALYSEFIIEAARLFGDALTRQAGNVTDVIGLYTMTGRLRLLSAQTVIDAAVCLFQG